MQLHRYTLHGDLRKCVRLWPARAVHSVLRAMREGRDFRWVARVWGCAGHGLCPPCRIGALRRPIREQVRRLASCCASGVGLHGHRLVPLQDTCCKTLTRIVRAGTPPGCSPRCWCLGTWSSSSTAGRCSGARRWGTASPRPQTASQPTWEGGRDGVLGAEEGCLHACDGSFLRLQSCATVRLPSAVLCKLGAKGLPPCAPAALSACSAVRLPRL